MSSAPPSLVTMLRSEKTRPKISFSSSACERPRCPVGAAMELSLGPPAAEPSEALDVGRVVLLAVVVDVPEEETGRGVQRRLYMHSAAWC